MSKMAEQITGLTAKRLQDRELPSYPDVYFNFLRFIEAEMEDAGPGAVPLLVGHNIYAFDVPLLLHSARNFNLPAVRDVRILDTMVAARGVLTGSMKPTNLELTTLYAHLTEKDVVTAHRAAADVEMTMAVLTALG